MSRKTPSFSQLLNYLNKGRKENDEFFFKHNVYSNDSQKIINEFHENYRNLKKQKNSNSLYHEIISLKHQKNLSVEQQRIILQDLAQEYVKIRATNNLVYAVIHEQHNQIHCHLMISSNEVENHRNKRLSQRQFEDIKEGLENYGCAKYPLLERLEKKKTKSRTKSKTIDREVHLKKRTGKQTKREQFKDRLHKIFTLVKSQDEFINLLKSENIEIYQRGNSFGFLDLSINRKYRLKTLELESEFNELSKNFTSGKEHQKEQKVDKETQTKEQKVFDHKSIEKEQANDSFRQKMKEARERNIESSKKLNDKDKNFTKK